MTSYSYFRPFHIYQPFNKPGLHLYLTFSSWAFWYSTMRLLRTKTRTLSSRIASFALHSCWGAPRSRRANWLSGGRVGRCCSHMTFWDFGTPPVTVPLTQPISTIFCFWANPLPSVQTSYVNGPWAGGYMSACVGVASSFSVRNKKYTKLSVGSAGDCHCPKNVAGMVVVVC